jgi:hypothetical protein
MNPSDSNIEGEDQQPKVGAESAADHAIQNEGEIEQAVAVNSGVATPSPAIDAQANQRPERVESLLLEGGVFDGWFLANRHHTRFYVLNLEKVLTDLDPKHTKLEAIFRAAERAIAEETTWHAQYRFEYRSSHTQIFPEKRFKAKLFGHAATIIVAMELIAAEIDPGYNVYDYLRIVPATFFIDRFNRNQLRRLDDHYASLTPEEREAQFGDLIAASFEQVLLNALEQAKSERLLEQMVAGHTVTPWICDRLREFVATNFPAELHLDETRHSGDPDKADAEPEMTPLGSKGAAPALRVPRRRDAEKLPTCR